MYIYTDNMDDKEKEIYKNEMLMQMWKRNMMMQDWILKSFLFNQKVSIFSNFMFDHVHSGKLSEMCLQFETGSHPTYLILCV